jgi:hypothetical protein
LSHLVSPSIIFVMSKMRALIKGTWPEPWS